MDPVNHGWGEDLEAYVLGRIAPDRLDLLEEHLLTCGACRKALDETVFFFRSLRQEKRQLAESNPTGWFGWLRTPVFATVAGALLLIVGASWYLQQRKLPQVPLATIQLLAVRGEMPVVERSRQTELHLTDVANVTGTVEVVDSRGGAVWKGRAVAGQAVRIRRALDSDTYFVRFYDGARLVHEYGFRVK